MACQNSTLLTTSEVAKYFGCRTWQIRRLFERGLLPPARRFGSYRSIARRDLPAVEKALRKAGYLSEVSNAS